MKLGKSVFCFCLSGLLILGWLYFINIDTSTQANTNVQGTVFEGQYNSFNALISHSTVIIMVVALIFAVSGIFFALDGLKSKRRVRKLF